MSFTIQTVDIQICKYTIRGPTKRYIDNIWDCRMWQSSLKEISHESAGEGQKNQTGYYVECGIVAKCA